MLNDGEYERDVVNIRHYLHDQGIPIVDGETVELECNDVMRTYKYEETKWKLVQENKMTVSCSDLVTTDVDTVTNNVAAVEHVHNLSVVFSNLNSILDAFKAGHIAEGMRQLEEYVNKIKTGLSDVKGLKEKKKRSRNEYNAFISAVLNRLKTERSDLPPPQRMSIAVAEWHLFKSHTHKSDQIHDLAEPKGGKNI